MNANTMTTNHQSHVAGAGPDRLTHDLAEHRYNREPESPYELARRLHTTGQSPDAVEQALRARGLGAEDARIAARAGRGEAGQALGDIDEVEAVSSLATEPPTSPPEHPCPQHAAWPVTATCSDCGRLSCDECLRGAGLHGPPASTRCPECEAKVPTESSTIGGWLLFPAIDIFLAPLSVVVLPLLRISTSGDLLSVVLDAGYFAYSFLTATQFFTKKRLAVPLMLGFYSLCILSSALVAFDGRLQAYLFGRAFMNGFVWITYFLNSKRVERTFTR